MTSKFELKRRLTQSFRKVSLKFGDLGQPRTYDAQGFPEPPSTPLEADAKEFFSISFDEHVPDDSSDGTTTRGSRSHSEASMASEHFSYRTEPLAPMITPLSPSSRAESVSSPQMIRPASSAVGSKDVMGMPPPMTTNAVSRVFGPILPSSPESYTLSPSDPSAGLEESQEHEEAAAEAAAAEEAAVHADIAAEKIALDILNKVQDQREEKEGWTI